jgi:hypothetical protein
MGPIRYHSADPESAAVNDEVVAHGVLSIKEPLRDRCSDYSRPGAGKSGVTSAMKERERKELEERGVSIRNAFDNVDLRVVSSLTLSDITISRDDFDLGASAQEFLCEWSWRDGNALVPCGKRIHHFDPVQAIRIAMEPIEAELVLHPEQNENDGCHAD